ncbi:transcription factor HAP3 [Histoplasma ohiense]
MASNCKCCSHNENRSPRQRQDREGGKRMHARMCERVHLVHHQRSFGKMSTREKEDSQWGRHPLCDDLTRIRELLRSAEDISFKISRNPILKGGEPEPATEQRVRRTSRGNWKRCPRCWQSSGTRFRGRTRDFQQHIEPEPGPQRTGRRNIRIFHYGGPFAQWCRWRDLLTLANTFPGLGIRSRVTTMQNCSCLRQPRPRARPEEVTLRSRIMKRKGRRKRSRRESGSVVKESWKGVMAIRPI